MIRFIRKLRMKGRDLNWISNYEQIVEKDHLILGTWC